MGTWEGLRSGTYEAEDEPKRREAGSLGTGRGGEGDGGDGSKEMRRGLS